MSAQTSILNGYHAEQLLPAVLGFSLVVGDRFVYERQASNPDGRLIFRPIYSEQLMEQEKFPHQCRPAER